MAKTDKKSTSAEQSNQRAFVIKQLFINQSSLKVNQPAFELTEEWNPEANMNLDVRTKAIENGHHVVDLDLKIDVKIGKKDIFTIELVQSGIFEVSGYTDEQNDQLLNSFCPNILFPYARQLISQLTNQAGFPPLIVAPVDFDGRHQQLKAAQAAQ